ncbi:transposase [Sphingobium sp. AR-3-1]|uniref:Transposase n=1 Tax=Sphingobium psychrophilum TaxID=2728834 RepID=A0A7X9WVN8_9SPHN|nr:transposase [Sphingobium psychrophilum]
MGQITVFGGPERRRRWREDERAKILAEASTRGACVVQVARQYDVSTHWSTLGAAKLDTSKNSGV